MGELSIQFPAMTQAALFNDKPKKTRRSPEEAFREFDSQHPEIYRTLVMRSMQMRRYGFERYSMRTLWEVLRWDLSRKRIATGKDQEFELNNNFAPFYARQLMARIPELKGFFEIRECRR